MDTEKIKQMGRDYFTANPDAPCRPLGDPAFKAAFFQWGDNVGESVSDWRSGWSEARYAASKEGRAIELLGLLFMTDMNGDPDAVEVEAKVSAFLQEIGWKPTP